MAKDKEVLEITVIQDADGRAYDFTVWSAHYHEVPYYILAIGAHSAFECFCCKVDPRSLQILTVWSATAVLRVSKSMAVKRTRIQDEGDVIVFALSAHASELLCYQLDIRIQGHPALGFKFLVDLYGLQKLTAWFANAALCASKYEADHPHS